MPRQKCKSTDLHEDWEVSADVKAILTTRRNKEQDYKQTY